MEDRQLVNSIAVGLSALVGYFSELDWELLFIYLIIMVSDVLIAKLFAKANGEYLSRKNTNGLYKKVGELLTLLTLVLLQRVTMKVGINVPFSPTITAMFIFKEVGSILETLAVNNVDLPPGIQKWFEKSIKEAEKYDKSDESI